MHGVTGCMRRPTLYMMASCAFTCLFLHDIYTHRRLAGAGEGPGSAAWGEVGLPEDTPGPTVRPSPNPPSTTQSFTPDPLREQVAEPLVLDFREPRLEPGLAEDVTNPLLVKVKDMLKDNTVIVILVTDGQVEFGCNFYISSLLRHNITNYIFIGLDRVTCDRMTSSLRKPDINCFVYATDDLVEEATLSTFKSKRKLHFHVKLIHQLLSYGLTVVYTDVETCLLRDAPSAARARCDRRKCDIMAPLDGDVYNLGFLYIKPTDSSKLLYRGMLQLAGDTPSIEQAFRWSLRNMLERKHRVNLFTFPGGSVVTSDQYFQNESCPDTRDYTGTLAILPKSEQTKELRTLRLRDCLLWNFDGNSYYSSTSRRYVMYESAIDLSKVHKALMNLFLIGSVANRTVILPRLYRSDWGREHVMPSWTLGSSLDIRGLDRTLHPAGYREGNFLQHPLVPASVRASLSRPYQITQISVAGPRKLKDVIPIVVNSSMAAVTDIGRVLNKSKYSVAQLKPFLRVLDEELYVKYLGQQFYDFLSYWRYKLSEKS